MLNFAKMDFKNKSFEKNIFKGKQSLFLFQIFKHILSPFCNLRLSTVNSAH